MPNVSKFLKEMLGSFTAGFFKHNQILEQVEYIV
jgi:hypothetical protein